MKRKVLFSICAALSIAVLAPAPAGATVNIFLPISGAAFSPVNDQQPVERAVGGLCMNWSTTTVTVTASLGRAAGGTNSFYISGQGNGSYFPCTINAQPTNGANALFYSNSTFAKGAFTYPITTNPAAGDYFYSVTCQIPAENATGWAFISGVKPDH